MLSIITKYFLDNPVLIKEIRSRMRGWRAFGMLMIYIILLSIGIIINFSVHQGIASNTNWGRDIFITLMVIQAIFLSLSCVGLSASTITTEREKQTYSSLLLTPLSPAQIIWGKLGAISGYMLLLLLASLPLLIITIWFGGVSLGEILSSYLLLFSASIIITLFGILSSTIFNRTRTANGVMYFLLLIGGQYFLIMPFYMFAGGSSVFQSLYYFGISGPTWLIYVLLSLQYSILLL